MLLGFLFFAYKIVQMLYVGTSLARARRMPAIDSSATARKEAEMMNLNIGDGQIPSRKERNSPT